jgi:hypothetical protein
LSKPNHGKAKKNHFTSCFHPFTVNTIKKYLSYLNKSAIIIRRIIESYDLQLSILAGAIQSELLGWGLRVIQFEFVSDIQSDHLGNKKAWLQVHRFCNGPA